MAAPTGSGLWFKLLLAAGAVLAVALLGQTVVNYTYVSENLVRQEARRVAEDRVRGVERAARLARAQDAAGLQAVLDDVRDDVADQVAGLALVQIDGAPVASSGQPPVPFTADERQRLLSDRNAPLITETRDGRDVFAGVFASRLRLQADEGAAGRLLITIAIYRDSLSAPFARLRRNAIISASAALTLLLALALIGLRFGAYVRGKQLEGEMAIARDVQRGLLAPAAAWPPGVDGAAVCVPASSIGGDLYDVQPLAGGRLAFSIGDVSGHGLPAALLMSLLHGAMSRSAPPAADDALDVTAARLNELLRTRSTGERFASAISCVYDPAARELRYVNAGHPPGLLLRHDAGGAERVTRLSEGGPVLGVLRDPVYRVGAIAVQDADLLVLYSDGILETTSRAGEYYGEGRLLDVVERHRAQPAGAICEAVLASVAAFAGGRPAADDRTLLIVRLRKGE